MTKGPTKAQLALAEAREWIEASKIEVRRCEAVLTEAESRLEMNERLYAILEKTFTRQSGKATTKKAGKKASKSAGKSARASSLQQQIQGRVSQSTVDTASDPRTVVRCLACGNDEDYQDHFRPSPHYHEFDDGVHCTAQLLEPLGKVCGASRENPIHHDPEVGVNHHPFGKSPVAQPAAKRSSSRNGSQSVPVPNTQKTAPSSPSERHEPGDNAASSPVSSEVEKESVSSATGD